MSFPEIISFVFVLILCIGFGVLFLRKKQKLSRKTGLKFIQKIKDTKNLDPAHAILESHKIFVATLSEFFSNTSLTAAQKISKIAYKFPNTERIWHFHKLRNKIAHEVEVKISKQHAEEARNNFIRALKSIMK